jgi:hypothetical protein
MTDVTNFDVEAELQARGLAPFQLTPERVDSQIVSTVYTDIPGAVVCSLILRNGFVVSGVARGRDAAFHKARAKVWELEEYLRLSVLAANG